MATPLGDPSRKSGVSVHPRRRDAPRNPLPLSFPTKTPAQRHESEKKSVGRGLFLKCAGCAAMITAEEMRREFHVCPRCGYHHPMEPHEWRRLLLDQGHLELWDEHIATGDPLRFFDGKDYPERISIAREKTGRNEGIEVGHAAIDGRPVAYGLFLFRFMGGSMGSVTGERITRLFERANDKAPHASAAYNAAVSYDYAKKRARAADAYQLALTLANLEPAQSAQAEQRLAELGLQLGYVHIAKPVGGLATVGRIERQPIPLRFYQEPGAYTIELETPEGEKTSTQVVVVGGQTLRVELNPIQRASLPPDTKPLERTPLPQLPSSTDPVTPEPNSTQEVLGWVGIGIGVAAAGVAAYLGYQVWRNQDAYLESGRTDVQRYNDHETLRARTNAAWATSGLTGALGATLLLTSPTFEF